jgi:hypothetical protein
MRQVRWKLAQAGDMDHPRRVMRHGRYGRILPE